MYEYQSSHRGALLVPTRNFFRGWSFSRQIISSLFGTGCEAKGRVHESSDLNENNITMDRALAVERSGKQAAEDTQQSSTSTHTGKIIDELGDAIQLQLQQRNQPTNTASMDGDVDNVDAAMGQLQQMRQQQSTSEDGLQYGEGKYDDDDEFGDPEEMIREFGRHPMMDRVQEALYNQLLKAYERVTEELRYKNADVKK